MDALDPDDVVGFLVVRAYHVLGRRHHEVLAPLGLTPMQFGVLTVLARGEATTQAALARAVLVTPQSLGEMLDGLEERGLLARVGERGRGRRVPVRITTAGRRLLARASPRIAALSSAEALGLTDRQRADLRRLLLRVLETIDAP